MLTLAYPEQIGGLCNYLPTNSALTGHLSLELDLGESESSQSRAVEAAQQLAADAGQYLGVQIEASTDPNDYPPTPPVPPTSLLRIYSHPAIPQEVAALPNDLPPLSYDFGLLGLQKATTLRPADLGDIPEIHYTHEGEQYCRRLFSFDYAADAEGSTALTVTETPGWARQDGTWFDGPTKAQVYSGSRYNAWRDSARERIFGGLKTWLPQILLALEEVVDIPEGEALSGAWLAANHAAPWSLYMSSGRKELITASLLADTATDWLDSDVPAGVVEGVGSGTVREMILGALR